MKKQYTINFLKKETSSKNAVWLFFFYLIPLITFFILFLTNVLTFEETLILFLFLWLFNMQKIPVNKTVVEINDHQEELEK